ncbi:MAG: M48 family metallopeptidase [Synergistaceae bacterium]|nr:M48 family metallopeptidase [Synergistaceae bacterium]MBQ7168951.1 M48 family metallopeptidase [Synergistaceae bacterium]
MKTVALMLLLALCGTSSAEISKITINKAWKRITKADNFPRVSITYEKDSAPNAWVKSEGGGKLSVHVTKGLMRLLDTEDEIAGVLGHELGHIRLGHYEAPTPPAYSAGINSDVAARFEGFYGEGELSAREEREADDYGVKLLRKVRYKPRGLYDALSKMASKEYVRRHNGFMSEPVSRERLEHVAEEAGISYCIEADSLIGMDDVAEIMRGKK